MLDDLEQIIPILRVIFSSFTSNYHTTYKSKFFLSSDAVVVTIPLTHALPLIDRQSSRRACQSRRQGGGIRQRSQARHNGQGRCIRQDRREEGFRGQEWYQQLVRGKVKGRW